MNKFIEKIKFKKIIIIYLVLLIISIIGITIFIGSKYYGKLYYLYNYHKIDEKYNQKNIKEYLYKLSKKSNDIIDIVIVNDDKIIYSVNNKYKNDLVRIDNTINYYKDSNNNIYKLQNKEEFILSLFSLNKYDNYYDEFNKDYNEDYEITYLKSNNENEKIIFINKINEVQNSHLYLKISISVLILFFMLYLIITSLMVFQNAYIIKSNAYFWGILTLFTNIIGVIIYLIYKNRRIICNKCNVINNKNNIYCINCGNKINECCKKCHSIINKKDKYCKNCGQKI